MIRFFPCSLVIRDSHKEILSRSKSHAATQLIEQRSDFFHARHLTRHRKRQIGSEQLAFFLFFSFFSCDQHLLCSSRARKPCARLSFPPRHRATTGQTANTIYHDRIPFILSRDDGLPRINHNPSLPVGVAADQRGPVRGDMHLPHRPRHLHPHHAGPQASPRGQAMAARLARQVGVDGAPRGPEGRHLVAGDG